MKRRTRRHERQLLTRRRRARDRKKCRRPGEITMKRMRQIIAFMRLHAIPARRATVRDVRETERRFGEGNAGFGVGDLIYEFGRK
jgi:hypothetical protein